MSRSRHLLACVLALGVFALVLPGVGLAACGGGGSAGDQQYVDPLASCHHSSTSSTTPASTTPVTTPAASAATTTTTTATAPTATTATSTAPGKSHGKSLPYTGFDLRWALGLGLVLVLSGAGLRRGIQNS